MHDLMFIIHAFWQKILSTWKLCGISDRKSIELSMEVLWTFCQKAALKQPEWKPSRLSFPICGKLKALVFWQPGNDIQTLRHKNSSQKRIYFNTCIWMKAFNLIKYQNSQLLLYSASPHHRQTYSYRNRLSHTTLNKKNPYFWNCSGSSKQVPSVTPRAGSLGVKKQGCTYRTQDVHHVSVAQNMREWAVIPQFKSLISILSCLSACHAFEQTLT